MEGYVGAAGPAGSDLIGKLEGPEVVTDAAQFPKSFQEAPQLAELVKAGKLPPVQERVSQDPLVIKPVHDIGKYGGTWRRGFSGPADFWNGYRCCGHDKVLFWDIPVIKSPPMSPKARKSPTMAAPLPLPCARA
jgi:peptide/nickel transport system substrate-binding protein